VRGCFNYIYIYINWVGSFLTWIIFIINFFLIIIPVLLNVAFITLLERKVLGYSQLRKGPNKVGGGGIFQPFNDAIKLFSKESTHPVKGNNKIFLYSPVIAMSISILIWVSYPSLGTLSQSFSIIIIYIVIRMNIYPLIISGWSSNSNYAIIGRLRGVAQTISYEIRLALILMFIFIFRSTLSVYSSMVTFFYFRKFLIFFPLTIIWLISCVAETNRTPFDFAEGESELVSGFNIEYGSGGFALIFMAEYASIYFISTLFVLLFFSHKIRSFITPLIASFFVFIWIWLRATLPRYRYDMLISLAWFSFLPSRLLILAYRLFLVL